jgi:hypothetical protein
VVISGYKLFGFDGIASRLSNISGKKPILVCCVSLQNLFRKRLFPRKNVWTDGNPERRQNLINSLAKYSYEYAP